MTMSPDHKHVYVVGYKGGPSGSGDDDAIARIALGG